MANKQRLDLILVERGLAPTRSVAQGLIMAGKVQSNTKVLDKPGQNFHSDIELQVAEGSKYVSRGGDKLASVADALKLSFEGKIVLDVGSSTGGFTDYALQNGAVKSYAVDVGNGQLAYKMRQDPRVVVMERTDIRSIVIASEARQSSDPSPRGSTGRSTLRDEHSGSDSKRGHGNQKILNQVQDDNEGKVLPEPVDIAVIDVSFISLTKILLSVANLVKSGAPIVAMMKPQFETDKPTADRYKGVIKDEKVRQQIIQDFESAIKPDFQIIASADSSVHGAGGNRERFYLLRAASNDRVV